MARDFTCAAVLLAIAGSYFLLASDIGRSALSDEVGPAGLPIAYAVLLGALGLALALKTAIAALAGRIRAEKASKLRTGFVLARAAGALAIGAFYVAIVNVLGYWLGLALLVPAMAVYQGERWGRRLVIIALVGATVFWCIFVWLLGIPMPSPWFMAAG